MSSKITDLATITGAALATTDWLMTVDISDATMALSGTDKKVSVGELLVGMGGLTKPNADLLYSALGHAHAAGDITSGVLANARIATGTPDGSKFLRDDQVWSAVSASDPTKLPLAGGTMTGQITSTLGTITTDIRALSATATWNASGTTFKGIFLNVTNTASAATSTLLDLQVGGVSELRYVLGTALYFGQGNAGTNDAFIAVVASGTKQMYFGANAAGIMTIASGYGALVKTGNVLGWTASVSSTSITMDTTFYRTAQGVVELNNGTLGTYGSMVAKEVRFAAPTSANGQYLSALSLTELTTIAAAATTDTTIQMPANAIVLGVSVRVTTVIPTATTFDVGDSGLATRFNTAAVGVAAASTDAGTKAGAYYNATALSVRLTMNGGTPAANTGRVRITIHYLLAQPPTS